MHQLFISHCHADKPVARRVARRLQVYGMKAWLDERELRLGSPLSATLREHLEASDLVVVIASAAAARSEWVRTELEFARGLQPARQVCPLFIEPVQTHPLFKDALGLDVTDLHMFEHAVLKLAEAVVGAPLPPPAAEGLRAGLEEARREDPGLALLIDACLGGGGLPLTQLESVAALPFHALDYALNALCDLEEGSRKERVAFHAAHLFGRTGVGTYALERYVESPAASATVLSVAIGCSLNAPELDPALRLLARCAVPNDQALAGFIEKNAQALTGPQWGTVIRLMTSPQRGPRGFILDAVFAALRHHPSNQDLKALWERWITQWRFDGIDKEGEPPRQLAWYLGEAHKLGLEGWVEITDALVSHVRRLARSKDKEWVRAAVEHVMATAERNPSLLTRVAHECSAAPGTAEWDGWPLAREMSIYVNAFVQAALTDRDWLRAWEEYQQRWRDVQALQDALSRDRDTPSSSEE